jgi:hypothetical protein
VSALDPTAADRALCFDSMTKHEVYAAGARAGLEHAALLCEAYADELEQHHSTAPGFVREAAGVIRSGGG